MADPASFQPDPSVLEGITQAPFVILPEPMRLFKERQDRFAFLATSSELGPYLGFLAELCRAQAKVAFAVGTPAPIAPEQLTRARANAMPPIDRAALSGDPHLIRTLNAFFDQAEAISKPTAAAEALRVVRRANESALKEMIANVLADAIPADALAEHLYVSAGTQVYAAGLAASLTASNLVPVEMGVCPACGGPPVASIVLGMMGAEGARYGACALCGTLWNEVRVKCMACGSTKGIGYREAHHGETEKGEEATVKAEVCDVCRSWVKILYQNRNPSLNPVADDVASLGLDLLMRDTEYRRAGFNPFLLGY